MGIFSAITGIFGGMQSASAASDAADEQVKGYETSANTVDKTVAGINPLIEGAYKTAGENVLNASNAAADGVTGAARSGADGATAAAAQANGYLNPYIGAGGDATATLAQLTQNPEETPEFTFSQNDPSFQFRLKQGEQALERNAALRGGLASGATLKAITNYAQGAASTEYAAEFDRWKQQQGLRMQQQSMRNQNLTTLAGMGIAAGSRAGDNTIGAAQYGGNMVLQGEKLGGDYRTAGTVYQSNAGTRSSDLQTKNLLDAGMYRAGSERGVAGARAAEHIGRANAWSGALGAVGGGIDSFVTGGFSGGGGFSLGDAVRYGR